MKRWSLVATGALVAPGLCMGCGGGEDSSSTETESLTIAWIPKEKGNEVFQVGLDGALLKALELTETTDHEVEVLYLAPQTASDIEGQKDSIQEAIDANVDAIAVSCSSPEVSEKIDQAIEAGIPTMAWDSDCRHPNNEASDRFTYFGIDNRTTGQIVGQLTEAVLKDDASMAPPYKIGILSGVPVATNLQERVAGVWDELKEMGTCRFNVQDDGSYASEPDQCWPADLQAEDATFHIYGDEPEKCKNSWDDEACATIYAEFENEQSGETLETLVERDRDDDGEADLDAVILIGLWPLFAYDESDNGLPIWTKAMQDGKLHTITYDTLEFQIDMARDGLIDALVGQKYWGWGYDVLQMVYDKLVNDAEFDPEFTDSGEDVVCPNNFAAMDNMWSSGDFTQTLPPCEFLE